jgi:Cas6 Crispr
MNAASATATGQIHEAPYVNISFPLQGRQLPADHGYLLYSAVSRVTGRGSRPSVREGSSSGPGVPPVSALHKTDWLAIELISGFPSGRGLIALSERDATLRLRIPAEHYREVLPLAGKRLEIGSHQIRLGLPVARPIEPAPSLYARVVTIKKFTEAESFLEAVKRKLDSFGVKGRAELPLSEPPAVAGGQCSVPLDPNSEPETQNSKLNAVPRYRRRIVTIHGKSVVGFSVAVHELNDEDSLLLQAGALKEVSPDDGATHWRSIFSRRAMGCGFFNPVSAHPPEQDR